MRTPKDLVVSNQLCCVMVFVCLITVVGSSAHAEDNLAVAKIEYISFDQVYLDAGRVDGLNVGDRVTIRHGDSVIALLEVLAVSSNSSSCRIIEQSRQIEVGDVAEANLSSPPTQSPLRNGDSSPPNVQRQPVRMGVTTDASAESGLTPQLSGNVSVSSNHRHDRSEESLDYTQTSFAANLRIDRMFMPGLSFHVRTNGRHSARGYTYRTGVPESDWSGGVYELAGTYEPSESKYRIRFGRFTPRRAYSLGPTDGMLAEFLPVERLAIGALAGAEPQWQYARARTDMQKYGLYVTLRENVSAYRRDLVTIGAIAEYHGHMVSREYLYTQGRAELAKNWHLSHTVELDINSGWRNDHTNQTISLTSVYLSSRARLRPWLTGTITYDNRRNYWEYDNRTEADSIFDDNVRQGMRTRWDVTLVRGLVWTVGLGLRKRETQGSTTYSYETGFRKTGLFNRRTSANADISGFWGNHQNGYDLTARISQSIHRKVTVAMGAGVYTYSSAAGRSVNQRTDLTARLDIVRTLSLNSRIVHETGDDTNGDRVTVGLNYRF